MVSRTESGTQQSKSEALRRAGKKRKKRSIAGKQNRESKYEASKRTRGYIQLGEHICRTEKANGGEVSYRQVYNEMLTNNKAKESISEGKETMDKCDILKYEANQSSKPKFDVEICQKCAGLTRAGPLPSSVSSVSSVNGPLHPSPDPPLFSLGEITDIIGDCLENTLKQMFEELLSSIPGGNNSRTPPSNPSHDN